MEKKVYTVEEVRQILGVGRNKAYQICDGTRFRILKVGRSVLIPIQGFEEWLYGEDSMLPVQQEPAVSC